MTNEERYQQHLSRINAAISLKEADCVPVVPIVQCFPFLQAGYSMADILYDTDVSKSKESLLKFL